MTQPLALLLYEKLLPGSQLVNRLQDLGYRVETISDPRALSACVEQERPLLVLADLKSTHNNVCEGIAGLKQNPSTAHVPVIAFVADGEETLQAAGAQAGTSLVVSEAAILGHLKEILEQALQIE